MRSKNFFERQERLLQNNLRMRNEAAKIAKEPRNRRLKYLSIGIISVGIILELIVLIWYEALSETAILWLQGFTGVCAIMFLILVAVFLYRVNSKAINKIY